MCKNCDPEPNKSIAVEDVYNPVCVECGKKLLDEETQRPTHTFGCRHCIGGSCRNYFMECILLKRIGLARAKILLFGERNWKNYKNKRSIRYVDYHRLFKIKKK